MFRVKYERTSDCHLMEFYQFLQITGTMISDLWVGHRNFFPVPGFTQLSSQDKFLMVHMMTDTYLAVDKEKDTHSRLFINSMYSVSLM